MLDRQVRLLLRLGAAFLALSAMVSLILPSTMAQLLGLPLDIDPQFTLWNIRVSAGLLLPLAGFMALAAAFLPERALRQSGAIVAFFSALLALLMVLAPGPWGWGRIAFILIAALFTLLALKALRGRLRHR